MAIGHYVTDLAPGDVLGPVEFVLSPFVVREYCHAVELHQEYFQGSHDQIVPPTLVHLQKLRLYQHACPAGTGPTARVHVEYDATYHEAIRAGEKLRAVGKITDRYSKRERDYVHLEIELRAAADGRLLIAYRDTVILAYSKKDAA